MRTSVDRGIIRETEKESGKRKATNIEAGGTADNFTHVVPSGFPSLLLQ